MSNARMEEELMTVFSRSFLFSGNFCSFEVHFCSFLKRPNAQESVKGTKMHFKKSATPTRSNSYTIRSLLDGLEGFVLIVGILAGQCPERTRGAVSKLKWRAL